MAYKYIIIDGDSQSSMSLQTHVFTLGDFSFSGYANSSEEGLNIILEENPDVVFLGTSLKDSSIESNFSIINELYKYMAILPKFIIVSNTKDVAYEAMKYDIYDFILKPYQKIDILKSLLKFRKENNFSSIQNTITNPISQSNQEVSPIVLMQSSLPSIDYVNDVSKHENKQIKPNETATVDLKIDTESIKNELVQIVKQSLSSVVVPESADQVIEHKNNILCIKSYGDYRFIQFDDIVYLKADNNSTDIMLSSGDSITAFKTLKYFESSLPEDFVRVHNSHIINIKFVSRIHLGNSDCYLNKGKIKLPFSKSYKDNITTIIDLYSPNNSKED